MIFLTKNDFEGQIKTHTLDRITGNDDTVLDQPELFAISEMQGFLKPRFDVAAIFAATGSARSPIIVMFAVDMLLYHLYSRLDPSQIPQIRIDRYENAVEYLNMVAGGKLSPDLPPLVNEEGGIYNKFHIGSDARRPE